MESSVDQKEIMNTTPNQAPAGVTLVRLASLHPAARHAHWIALASVLLVPILILAVMWQVSGVDTLAQERLWHGLWNSLRERPDHLFAVIATPFVLLYLAVEQPARLQDRIVVDATGIAFQRPARFRLPLTPRAWSMSWTRLRKAELGSPLGPALVLTLGDGVQTRRIIVDEWLTPDTPRETVKALMKQRLQRRQKRIAPEEALRLAGDSPLVRALRARGVAIQRPDTSSPLVFDLFRNRHAVAAVILLAAIGLYGAVDLILLDETYAGFFPRTTWILGGVVAAALSYLWLSRAKLPLAVAAVLSLMIGADAGFAMYPGLLRLNWLTDTAGVQPHEYILREYVRLEPRETGLPAIEFQHGLEYWRQLQPGASYTLYLRRGGLGFYQLDLAPVYAATRAFYEKCNTCSSPRGEGGKQPSSPLT